MAASGWIMDRLGTRRGFSLSILVVPGGMLHALAGSAWGLAGCLSTEGDVLGAVAPGYGGQVFAFRVE